MAVLDGRQFDAREEGRLRFGRRHWNEAYRLLVSARDALDPEERLLLAMSAYLLGRDDECTAHLEDAYHAAVEADPAWAARYAFWLSFVLMDHGEFARGGGWVARGLGLLERHGLDGAERGYLLVPSAVQQLYAGQGVEAEQLFTQIVDVALRFQEPDLLTLGRLGHGQALVAQGRVQEALPELDEAMVAVIGDEVSPVIAGLVYCAVIAACQDTFDLRRAQEWTAALRDWCDSQPDLIPYRGQCQIHRAEILCLHGDWQDAMDEAGKARRRLSQPSGQTAVGAAIYQEAELYRLRGQLSRAEDAYREASTHGHDPQPGLARLRLAQGDPPAAVAALRRALDEGDRIRRPRLLAAFVDAALASDDLAAADAAAEELTSLAERHDVPMLWAMAAQATAGVELASDDAAGALRAARRAWTIWHEFGAPYESARARVLLGHACSALGDHDAARLELAAARRAFRQLGARCDLADLDRVTGSETDRPDSGLTRRETQVLLLVAEGRTNRSVAEELFLSEKTVARHLSNIYIKLGISSRSAATAWAYEHELR